MSEGVGFKRGDIVSVVIPGGYGKPRPAVIVQSDRVLAGESVMLCPLTTTLRQVSFYRLPVDPSEANGLLELSEVMADKMMALPRHKIGYVFGSLEPELLAKLTTMLAALIGVGDDE